MPAEGGGAGGKGILRDNSASRGGGGRDKGHHPYDAHPLGVTQPRG